MGSDDESSDPDDIYNAVYSEDILDWCLNNPFFW